MIRFKLKSYAPADAETLVFMTVRWRGGHEVKISTGMKIRPDHWQKGFAKHSKAFPYYRAINSKMQDLRAIVHQVFEENNDIVGDLHLKYEVEKRWKGAGVIAYPTVMDAIMLRKGGQSTVMMYQSVANIVTAFQKETRIKCEVNCIDLRWKDKFVEWCYARENKGRTVNVYLNQIAITMRGLAKEYNLQGDYNGKAWRVPELLRRTVTLTPGMVAKVAALDYTDKPQMKVCQFFFLMQCATGMRVSDITRIKPSWVDLDQKLIHITTVKTKVAIVLPLLPEALAMMEKYGWKFPEPFKRLEDYNDLIGQMCQDAGLVEMVYLTEMVGGKVVEYEKPFHDLVTSHTARRTFATNFNNMGIPSKTLMKLTGHKTESSFMRYIDSENMDAANEVARVIARGG